jgi:mannose-6-phosphate isomerase-like protein (cupin superfamily)
MKYTDTKNAIEKKNPHGIKSLQMVNKESSEVLHLTLEPGQELKPHSTPVDVLFFILEGSPTIRIGDEYMDLKAETIVESPKNITHCIYNKSNTIARVIVIKTPNPHY